MGRGIAFPSLLGQVAHEEEASRLACPTQPLLGALKHFPVVAQLNDATALARGQLGES